MILAMAAAPSTTDFGWYHRSVTCVNCAVSTSVVNNGQEEV